jgi:nucleotide-binding universal stress UspA family protein
VRRSSSATTDRSRPGGALEYAAELADDGPVVVASVTPSLAGPPFSGLPEPLAEADHEQLLAEAERIPAEHRVQAKTVQPVGDPAAALIRTAEEEGSTLIIVGTHGRTAFERFLVGSVSTRLTRDAPCDVLVVR